MREHDAPERVRHLVAWGELARPRDGRDCELLQVALEEGQRLTLELLPALPRLPTPPRARRRPTPGGRGAAGEKPGGVAGGRGVQPGGGADRGAELPEVLGAAVERVGEVGPDRAEQRATAADKVLRGRVGGEGVEQAVGGAQPRAPLGGLEEVLRGRLAVEDELHEEHEVT